MWRIFPVCYASTGFVNLYLVQYTLLGEAEAPADGVGAHGSIDDVQTTDDIRDVQSKSCAVYNRVWYQTE